MKRKSAKKPTAGTRGATDSDGGKVIRTGIYRDDGRSLLVPTVKMWDARPLFRLPEFQRPARTAKHFGHGANVNAIESAIGTAAVGGKRAQGTIKSYKRLYAKVDYFAPWLTSAVQPPEAVHVASAADVKHAKAAWSYRSILDGLGGKPGAGDYHAWFTQASAFPIDPPTACDDFADKQRRIVSQVQEFMLWLYGGDEPTGWLILPEWVVWLRDELTPSALCRAASLNPKRIQAWKKDATVRQALVDAIAAVRAGRPKPDSSDAWGRLCGDAAEYNPVAIRREAIDEATRRLAEGESYGSVSRATGISKTSCGRIARHERNATAVNGWTRHMADSILRVAKAARISDAIARVVQKHGSCGSRNHLRQKAERLGVLDALDGYVDAGVAGIAEEHDVSENGGWNQRGVVGPGLFLPRPLMWEFRRSASTLWAEHQISALRQRTPCFMLWFLDWTLPLGRRGKVSPYREAVGLLPPSGRSPYRNVPETSGIKGRPEREGIVATTDSMQTPEDDPRLTAALARCETDRQRKIVRVVGQLTGGRPSYAPQGKEIAKAAADNLNSRFWNALSRCCELGALVSRNPGYRLPE